MSYPLLSQELVKAKLAVNDHLSTRIHLPTPTTFQLPEKILQFGSGAFLRGFFDYFIHISNMQGEFNGRIVVVQSTGGERSRILEEQEGLYTLCAQGLQDGRQLETFTVCSAISRALSARDDWENVLAFAGSPDLEIIVSNTTEAGVVFDEGDRLENNPPNSFPGKLTAVLYERFRAFEGDPNRGVVILPCELLEDNGDVLRDIVLRLIELWQLGDDFRDWIMNANQFCNTLVDRIVPGKPEATALDKAFWQVNFRDDLLTCAEHYSLFAIEGNRELAKKLNFQRTNPTIVISEDITLYRERKLRLLNAAHTISITLAYLGGIRYIIDMMDDPLFARFLETAMRQEIAPCLDMDPAVVREYTDEVLTRFRNPFLKHALIDISVQSTMKMRHRVFALIHRYYDKFGKAPSLLCLGFAGYLRFMKAIREEDGRYAGEVDDEAYPINDTSAECLYDYWQKLEKKEYGSLGELVLDICSNSKLWGDSIISESEIVSEIEKFLSDILRDGSRHTVDAALKEYS